MDLVGGSRWGVVEGRGNFGGGGCRDGGGPGDGWNGGRRADLGGGLAGQAAQEGQRSGAEAQADHEAATGHGVGPEVVVWSSWDGDFVVGWRVVLAPRAGRGGGPGRVLGIPGWLVHRSGR